MNETERKQKIIGSIRQLLDRLEASNTGGLDWGLENDIKDITSPLDDNRVSALSGRHRFRLDWVDRGEEAEFNRKKAEQLGKFSLNHQYDPTN